LSTDSKYVLLSVEEAMSYGLLRILKFGGVRFIVCDDHSRILVSAVENATLAECLLKTPQNRMRILATSKIRFIGLASNAFQEIREAPPRRLRWLSHE